MSKRFIHFSRFGAYLGELTPMQATRTRNVDQCGVDKVELILLDNGVDKYDRIVFCDSMGRTCEWIVMSSRESRAKSAPICTVNCYGSMQELSRHFMPTLRRGSKDTPEQALAKALDGTRWSVGQCDEGSGEYSVYHQSSLASVKDIAEAYKMEVEPVIELSADGNSIAKRSVRLVKRLGRANTALRLDYGSGLSGIDRVLSADDVVTRLYCYGKGVQTTDDEGNVTGGYSRKITFADINGGKEYIQDDSLLEIWGVPGPDGSLMHTEGIFEDGDCEDKATLLAEGRAALAERSKPIVSYEGTVEALGRAGFDANACDLGDNLQMVDTTFPKPLRLSGRVLEIVEDLLGDGSPSSVKVGNVIEGIIKRSDRVQQTIDRLTSSAGSWDSAATLGSAYLDGLIDGLNKVMNETGGYTYIKPGKGLFVYDKPEEANPTMCIQIGGGYFRIADGKNSDGTWNFRTLGNGHGLVADAIVSGTISANLIKAGIIQDKSGKNYWNLDASEVHLGPGATLDDKDIATTDTVVKSTVKLYAKNQSDTVPPLNMQNPELGWSEDIPEWSNGYFIWEMDRVTYGDGSVTHTAPVLEAAYNKAYQSAHDLTGSLNSLDTTVQDLAKDGVVTEAEAAAVKKAKQDVDKEREEMTSQYNALKSNKALSAQFLSSVLGPRYTKAFGTTDEGGTYGSYADKVDKVLRCKTAEELKAAMYEYDAAFGAYSTAVKDYADAATWARHAIEQKNASDYADGILSAYDEQMDQKAIFDRLTKGGTEQGIYMQNDRVYINASYMATGTIADAKGRNSWNLKDGVLKTNYMTANNITANGTFKCGYTNWYTMLTSAGELAGYRTTNGSTPTKVGYIDYTASMRDTDTGAVYYGIQMQAQGSVRISSPIISTAATSDRNVTTIYGRTGSVSQPLVSEVHDNHDGTVGWHYGTFVINTINGLFTSYSTVGTTG
ncbi:MAG: phage tail spike protein [Collinsella sp.]|nr:phage tail spike protein [Collinsella sp.]MDU6508245.1 phage tail spike protein [Collinsella sp.]